MAFQPDDADGEPMPVFACPKCATHLSVAESAAAQTVACPKCGQVLSIPAPAPAVAPGPPPTPPRAPALPVMSPSRPAPPPSPVTSRPPLPTAAPADGAVQAGAPPLIQPPDRRSASASV